MQLNIRFFKKILNIMQEKQSHYIFTTDLLEDVREECPEINREDFNDLFFGHLLLLKDNKVIEEIGGNDNLGIAYFEKGIHYVKTKIRLTSKGYDFIKVLNQNGIVDKLKHYTITECLKIVDIVIANSINNFMN